MRAAFRETCGDAKDVIQIGELPIPSISDTQVLVKVSHASLNPIDTMRMKGYLRAYIQETFPVVDGYDMSGTVVQVGSAVTKFAVGDEVFGCIHAAGLEPKQIGSFSEYTNVEEAFLGKKLPGISFIDAASLGVAAGTTLQALDALGLKAGDRVLITGGAGGVGTLAIQIAREMYGASFIATTASSSKVNLLTRLGASLVVDYKTQDFAAVLANDRFDVVFDTTGETDKALALLTESGTIGTIKAGPPLNPRVKMIAHTPATSPYMDRIAPLVESGRIKTVIERVFPFSEIIPALELLEARSSTGKIILEI